MDARLSYLIAAHSQPVHLSRLLDRILTENSQAFVHIDAKSEGGSFSGIEREGVTLCAKRVRVYWGEFSQVEATLELIRNAVERQPDFDYAVFISGADYPLCPASYIEGFFATHAGAEFMNIVAMPSEIASKPLSRLTDYKVPSGMWWTYPTKAVRRALRAAHVVTPRDFRPVFGELRPFAGSSWWALSRAACEHVLDFVAREHRVMDFFRNTWFADEMFFQTIIGNSPFRGAVRRNVTFTEWQKNAAHPTGIDARHLTFFATPRLVVSDDAYGSGEVLFARKFSEADTVLLDHLDAIIERKRRGLEELHLS
jgi:Core-2/I-Branching enzyme